MSQRASAFLALRNCSGAMKCGVPRPRPVLVRFRSASISLTSPRSASLATPSGVTRMLSGLTSRWTRFCLWARCRPWATWAMMRMASASGMRAVAVDPLAQRFALDELHDQIRRRAGFAVVQGADDVGMVEPAGGAELLLEALEQTWRCWPCGPA